MKKQSGFASILAIIIAILVAAAVWYLYYQAGQKGKQTGRTEVSPALQATDVYADWKIFSSSIEKLSFKYPADWTISTNTPPSFGSSPGALSESYTISGTNNFRLSVDVFANGGLGGACETCHIHEVSPITISGYGDLVVVVDGNYDMIASGISLNAPAGMAVGEGFAIGLFDGKTKVAAGELKGQYYSVHLKGAFDGTGVSHSDAQTVSDMPIVEFLAKTEVKIARQIFQSLTY